MYPGYVSRVLDHHATKLTSLWCWQALPCNLHRSGCNLCAMRVPWHTSARLLPGRRGEGTSVSERKPAPTVPAIVLGRHSAAHSETAGFTAGRAAARLRIARTTVTRMEEAERSLECATSGRFSRSTGGADFRLS